MQTIDVLAHPWLQIMLKQVEIGDSTCTGRIVCQRMQLMHTWGYQDTLHSRLEPALLGLQVGFKNLEGSIGVSSKSS